MSGGGVTSGDQNASQWSCQLGPVDIQDTAVRAFIGV